MCALCNCQHNVKPLLLIADIELAVLAASRKKTASNLLCAYFSLLYPWGCSFWNKKKLRHVPKLGSGYLKNIAF